MRAWTITKEKITNYLKDENRDIKKIVSIEDGIELPEINDDEALIKIVSTGINFNSVWTFEAYPVDSFSLLSGHIRRSPQDKKHMQDYFIPGSDGAGHIVKIKKNGKFKEGDEVVIHCASIDTDDLKIKDPMLGNSQSIWGYETNFGSFAEYSIVKTSQLIRKPKNLSWHFSGSYMLTLGTAYRMIATKNGLDGQMGQTCLIWGASGGLGVFAIQICIAMGIVPICVVSTKKKVDFCKKYGANKIICLEELEQKKFLDSKDDFNIKMWIEFSEQIKKLTGEKKVDLVFEHIGKETMGLSIYLLKKGGKVVTCAATSGYICKIDLRYLWMEMKKLIGSHFSNPEEAMQASQLISDGKVIHEPSSVLKFENLLEGVEKIRNRESLGKIAIILE